MVTRDFCFGSKDKDRPYYAHPLFWAPFVVVGEGEGLLAVTYRMTGDLGDPEVSVNPLSVLAPGFLRGLFSGTRGSGKDDRPRALPERPGP